MAQLKFDILIEFSYQSRTFLHFTHRVESWWILYTFNQRDTNDNDSWILHFAQFAFQTLYCKFQNRISYKHNATISMKNKTARRIYFPVHFHTTLLNLHLFLTHWPNLHDHNNISRVYIRFVRRKRVVACYEFCARRN